MSDPRQDVLDAMLAERYGRSIWWHRKADEDADDDSDLATARRRRAMAEDFQRASGSEGRNAG